MKYAYSELFKIRNYEADIDGNLKIPMLFNYFQEVAGNHAEQLGWGYDNMQELGAVWMLSRLQIEVKSLPKWGEEVEVLTLPRGIKKLFAVRDYAIHNRRGEELVKGYSGWLVVDKQTSRLKNPDIILGDAPWRDNPDDMAFSTEKMIPLENKIFEYTRKVTPNDMDVNKHTNNARYAEWMTDCFEQEFLSANQIRKISVIFSNQTKFGDEVALSLFANETGKKHYIEAVNTQTGQKVVQAEFEWK
jgi:acyl-ACP thioesterase